MTLGYHRDYRPTQFSEVIGQGSIPIKLSAALANGELPHAMLFTGPSGVGKTTCARILKSGLDVSGYDYVEINAADTRGIDDVRSIVTGASHAPMGKSKLIVLDECHQLTNAAQQCLLKLLEDCKSYVYVILITSEPQKLIPAIKTRTTAFAFQPVKQADLINLMRRVLQDVNPTNKTGLKELCQTIATQATGSPRAALVMLEAALLIEDADERLRSVEANTGAQSPPGWFDLAKALVAGDWAKTRKALSALDKTLKADHEGVRRFVLGYAATQILKQSNGQAATVANLFAEPFHDSDRGGIILASYLACNNG